MVVLHVVLKLVNVTEHSSHYATIIHIISNHIVWLTDSGMPVCGDCRLSPGLQFLRPSRLNWTGKRAILSASPRAALSCEWDWVTEFRRFGPLWLSILHGLSFFAVHPILHYGEGSPG